MYVSMQCNMSQMTFSRMQQSTASLQLELFYLVIIFFSDKLYIPRDFSYVAAKSGRL